MLVNKLTFSPLIVVFCVICVMNLNKLPTHRTQLELELTEMNNTEEKKPLFFFGLSLYFSGNYLVHS